MKNVTIPLSDAAHREIVALAGQRNLPVEEVLRHAFEKELAATPSGPSPPCANVTNRDLDPSAANLIAVSDKVLQVARGEIPLPEVVELWWTNYCDFACPHCRCARFHGRHDEHLSYPVLEHLLAELSERGVKRLEISGGGEPLQHPQALQLFERLIARGFRAGLITNGHAFVDNPALTDAVVACCDWVRISLDAISDDVFRTVHGRPNLDYRALRTAIKGLADRARSGTASDQRPHVGVKFIIQRPNQHQMVAAVDEAVELGAHYVQFKFLEDHPWSVPQGRERLREQILARVRRHPPGTLDVDILPGFGGERTNGRCTMSVLHPMIDWDGEIYLCAFFSHRRTSHSVGNIARQRFFDCWGSPHHRAQLQGVDPHQCVPNCPLLRYNPVIQFILREKFRFHYI